MIEAALKDACPAIGQACVIGDGRPHLAALLVLEPPDAGTESGSRATVAAAIETVNAALPRSSGSRRTPSLRSRGSLAPS
ncbi:MAG TPA: hypothetical protein VFW38_12120 [Solirubrobacteraceae bacterium]|nr:hypothetical protein [Solirubrobacteraceae bacterium]